MHWVLKWPSLHFKSTFEQNLKFFLCLESKVSKTGQVVHVARHSLLFIKHKDMVWLIRESRLQQNLFTEKKTTVLKVSVFLHRVTVLLLNVNKMLRNE